MSEKYKNIDDLFRDRFEHFEVDPPAHLLGNVMSELGKSSSASGKAGKKGKGLSGMSIVIIVAGMLTAFLMNHDDPLKSKSKNTKTDNAEFVSSTRSFDIIADNAVVPISTTSVQESMGDTSTGNEKSKKERKSSKKSNNRTKSKKPKSITVIDPVMNTSIDPKMIGKTDIRANHNGPQTNPIQAPFGFTTTSLEISNLSIQGLNANPDQKINPRYEYGPSLVKKPNKVFKDDYGKKGSWAAGAYFTPELIKYDEDNSFDNRSYSVELLVQHTKNNFLVQTGLGLSKVTDKGNYHIDYNKYLGSYEDVYDVTFDTVQGELIPVYYTETVDVYDTVYKTVITPTKRNFTYLNIPLMIGYSSESKRLGWFVKAGPSLSIMLSEKMSDVTMPDPENKIILSENELPQRVTMNWQFALSAGTTMKLNNYLSISIEPVFRYYIKSAYETNTLSTKHPYSIGLRTGILLDF